MAEEQEEVKPGFSTQESPTSPLKSAHTRTTTQASAKPPPEPSTEPLNIVILGASFAGLSCAHAFLDDTINHLRTTPRSPHYRLIIIGPSTHIYWNIGAPRILTKPGLINDGDAFIPIEPGFERHRGHDFTVIQGTCTEMSSEDQTVRIECADLEARARCYDVTEPTFRVPNLPVDDIPQVQVIPYHALLLCTGTSAHSPVLSLHGPHDKTAKAIATLHKQISTAKTICICGGGSSGVETAGQLATYLNFRRHFPFRWWKKSEEHTMIALITGGTRCLPELPEAISQKAEKKLKDLGVDVIHNRRVEKVEPNSDEHGSFLIQYANDTGNRFLTDVYIDCTGVSPNSSYVPTPLLNGTGYVLTNPSTLRIDAAGSPRVYCVGDLASYSYNYIPDVYSAIPVVMHNLLNDLLAHEHHLSNPYIADDDEKLTSLTDEVFVQRAKDSQLMPITRFGGVGILMGLTLPSILVHGLKGWDYRIGKARGVVKGGGSPYGRGKYK